LVDNKIVVGGADASFFNKEFIVKEIINLTSFITNAGVSTISPVTTGTPFIYKPAYASQGGNISVTNENSNGRIIAEYAGITTTISSAVAVSDLSISISNATNFDFNIGDYLLINNEILRIKTDVTTSSVSVFRGILGTLKSTHSSGSVITRINPRPIELRRNSLIRASAHTFEYVGFGPGNYSTAFPERQDRNISPQEELLAQSTTTDGGVVIFAAMNADGDFYTGNKKINSTTGQEEVFNSPIPTVTGEDPGTGGINVGFDIITPLEATISRSIRVEGGSDGNIISQFDGPIIFNNKITSNSTKGIEANSIFLQGDTTVSRKYTVGISTPLLAGNVGDVVYNAIPSSGGYLGWVYADDNKWKRFGSISTATDSFNPTFNIIRGNTYIGNNFIGTFSGDGSGLTGVDSIWGVDGIGIHTTRSVGVGTTGAILGNALYVNGNTTINGTLNVYEIIEKATISAGILTAQNPVGVATTTNIDLATNNVYYFTNQTEGDWSLNFRGDSTTSLNSFLTTGDSITVAILTNQGSTAYYNSSISIDNVSVTPKYYGGNQIVSGNSNSLDMYTYVIIKTGSATYTVLASQSQYA
jgi:hypothetical protein